MRRGCFNLVEKFSVVLVSVTFLLIFFENVPHTNCQNTNDIRLSTNVMPTNYDIHIKVDIPNRVFDGVETIYVHVNDESTDFIEIHALDLDITKIEVFNNDDDEEVSISSTEYFNDTEKFLMKFSENLVQQRNYRVHVEFKGELKNDMKGLYISSYYYSSFFLG